MVVFGKVWCFFGVSVVCFLSGCFGLFCLS